MQSDKYTFGYRSYVKQSEILKNTIGYGQSVLIAYDQTAHILL